MSRETLGAVRGAATVLFVVLLTVLGDGAIGRAADAEDAGPPKPPSHWRVSATINYWSGSYGTDSTTNIVYAPMTVRRLFRDGDVSLTIPFVSISGTGAVRLVGGTPTRTSNVASGGTASLSSIAASSGRGKGPGDTPLSSGTTDSGPGM
jgi:hypothetical protein